MAYQNAILKSCRLLFTSPSRSHASSAHATLNCSWVHFPYRFSLLLLSLHSSRIPISLFFVLCKAQLNVLYFSRLFYDSVLKAQTSMHRFGSSQLITDKRKVTFTYKVPELSSGVWTRRELNKQSVSNLILLTPTKQLIAHSLHWTASIHETPASFADSDVAPLWCY